MLIVKAIEQAGISTPGHLIREIATDEGQTRTRESLRDITSVIDVPVEAIDQRLAELSVIAAPVGVPWSLTPGRLRRGLGRLTEMRDSLLQWTTGNFAEVSADARFAADVAGHSIEIAAAVLAEYNEMIGSVLKLITRWETARDELAALASRLSWLLDGWDMPAELWLGAAARSRNDQIAAIKTILPILPVVPRQAASRDQSQKSADFLSQRRKWVRMNVDWRTGKLDPEMISRLEAAKARLA
jgi:hypothetical protein